MSHFTLFENNDCRCFERSCLFIPPILAVISVTRLFNLICSPQFKINIDESRFIYFAFYIHDYLIITAFKTHKIFTFIRTELNPNLPISAIRIASNFEPRITIMYFVS